MSSYRKQAALFSLAAAFLATATAQADEVTSATDSSPTAVTEAATPASPATSTEASTSNNTPTASGEAATTATEATPAAPQNSASDAKATTPVEGQEVTSASLRQRTFIPTWSTMTTTKTNQRKTLVWRKQLS